MLAMHQSTAPLWGGRADIRTVATATTLDLRTSTTTTTMLYTTTLNDHWTEKHVGPQARIQIRYRLIHFVFVSIKPYLDSSLKRIGTGIGATIEESAMFGLHLRGTHSFSSETPAPTLD